MLLSPSDQEVGNFRFRSPAYTIPRTIKKGRIGAYKAISHGITVIIMVMPIQLFLRSKVVWTGFCWMKSVLRQEFKHGWQVLPLLTAIQPFKRSITTRLRAAIGNDEFDRKFGTKGKSTPEANRLRIAAQFDPSQHPLNEYLISTEAARKDFVEGDREGALESLQEGEWYYFANHSQYTFKHPYGAFAGEHALYVGKDSKGNRLWSGLGLVRITEEKMFQAMVRNYNDPRTKDEIEYAKLLRTRRDLHSYSDDFVAQHQEGAFPDLIDVQALLSSGERFLEGFRIPPGGLRLEQGLKLDVEGVRRIRDSVRSEESSN